MKSLSTILGILLILFGVVALAYQGVTYTKREQVAKIGSVEITADKDKTVYFSPMTGGLALVAGIVLVVIGRRQQ
jgi:uncharacterized membrane protein